MVTKYRRQIAARVDEETYQKLCKQAVTKDLSVSVFLRKLVTNFIMGLEPENPPAELKEPPKVLAAKSINPVTLKKIEPEIMPSESLEHEEEELKKKKGLFERIQDFANKKIKIF